MTRTPPRGTAMLAAFVLTLALALLVALPAEARSSARKKMLAVAHGPV